MERVTAVIYLRVSTGRQAEKELPIDSQLAKCEEKAASLNAEVIKVFADEGISGRTDARPQFQNAISYCENFPVTFFITWSTSRFARNRLDAQLNKRRLIECGTKLEYVTVNIDNSNGSGIIHEGILELFDEYLSHQISADTRRSMVKNAQEGYWNGGRLPFGFIAVEDAENSKRKKLQAEPQEALIVEEIFKMRLDGYGGKSIAAILNDRGVKNRGKNWNKTSVTSLLRNEKVIGKTVFGKTGNNGAKKPKDEWVFVDSHQAVIDLNSWNQVQSIMDAETVTIDSSSPRSTWLYTGILKCGRCGAAMQIESAKGRSQRYYYYNCRNKQRGYCCDNRRIRADELDDWLSEVICAKLFTKEALTEVARDINELCGNWAVDQRKKRTEILKGIEQYQAKNSRLYGFLEDPEGPLNLDDLAPRIRNNKNQIRELESKLRNLEAIEPPEFYIDDISIEELAEFLTDSVRNTDNVKKTRTFLSSFIDKIVINESNIEINYREDLLLLGATSVVPSKQNWLRLLGSNQRPND